MDVQFNKFICFSGKQLGQIDTNSSVRTCAFSYSGNQAVFATDRARGHSCEMGIVDVKNMDSSDLSEGEFITKIAVNGPRVSALLWGALDETIITGHEDGEIAIWDARVHIFVKKNQKKKMSFKPQPLKLKNYVQL